MTTTIIIVALTTALIGGGLALGLWLRRETRRADSLQSRLDGALQAALDAEKREREARVACDVERRRAAAYASTIERQLAALEALVADMPIDRHVERVQDALERMRR